MRRAEIANTIAFFSPLGFFASYGALSGRALVDAVLERSRADAWAGDLEELELDPGDPRGFADLSVLAMDPARVLRLESWEILFDAAARDEGYAHFRSYRDLVLRLARLAEHRLVFDVPTASRKKNELTLRYAGESHKVRFRTDLAVFSPDVLRAVNEVIVPSGARFVFLTNARCAGFITLLGEDEERRILRARRWELEALE